MTSPQGGVLGRKFASLPASLECDFEVSGPQQGLFQVALFTYRSDAVGGNASPGMVQIQWNAGGVSVTHHDGQRIHTVQNSKADPAMGRRSGDGKVVRHSIL